jgi:hypothetical protein
MPLKIRVNYPIPDVKATTEDLHNAMVERLVADAKAFVLGATDVVPVWSGQLKATFLKAAHLAKVQLTISPAADAPNRVSLGIANSKGEFVVEKGKRYTFIWQSDVVYDRIIDEKVGYVEAGLQKLRTHRPMDLPKPKIKRSKS